MKEALDNVDMMFLPNNIFKEVEDNPHYFYDKKDGLKTKIIHIEPYEYVEAVELRQPDHKAYGPEQSKLDRLRKTYEEGTKVDMPSLAYGSRDRAGEDYFGQEGYHRAITAFNAGKKTIPVSIRYRESDKNIPDFIRKYLD